MFPTKMLCKRMAATKLITRKPRVQLTEDKHYKDLLLLTICAKEEVGTTRMTTTVQLLPEKKKDWSHLKPKCF